MLLLLVSWLTLRAFILLFQCCYWSDMFTGRLRSEIPPALVKHLLLNIIVHIKTSVGLRPELCCYKAQYPTLEKIHSTYVTTCVVIVLLPRPTFGDICFISVCLFVIELTGWRSDAGGCQADCVRPQWQRFRTRWGEGHWKAAQKQRLLHIAGAKAQQLRHGHRRGEGMQREHLRMKRFGPLLLLMKSLLTSHFVGLTYTSWGHWDSAYWTTSGQKNKTHPYILVYQSHQLKKLTHFQVYVLVVLVVAFP